MTRQQVEDFCGGDMRQANLLCRSIDNWRELDHAHFEWAVLVLFCVMGEKSVGREIAQYVSGHRRDHIRKQLFD